MTCGGADNKKTFNYPVNYKRSRVCFSTQCTPQDISKRLLVNQKQTIALVDSATSTGDLNESYYVLDHHEPQPTHPTEDNKSIQKTSPFPQRNFPSLLGTRYLKFTPQLRPQHSEYTSHKVAQCKHLMRNAYRGVIVPRDVSEGNVNTTTPLASQLVRSPSKVVRERASIHGELKCALTRSSHTVNPQTEQTMLNVEEFVDTVPRLFEQLKSEFHCPTNGMRTGENESSIQTPRHALQRIHSMDKLIARIRPKVTETRTTQTSTVSCLPPEVSPLDTTVNEANREAIAPIQSSSNSLLIMPTITQPSDQVTIESTNRSREGSGETKLWGSESLKNTRRKSLLNELSHGNGSQCQFEPKSLRTFETLIDKLTHSKELMEIVEKLLLHPKATILLDHVIRTQNVNVFQAQNGDKNDPLLKAILILIEQYRQSASTATGASIESTDVELSRLIAPSAKSTPPEPETVTPLVLRSAETTVAGEDTSQVEAVRKYPLKTPHVRPTKAKQKKTKLRGKISNDASTDSAGSELISLPRVPESSDSEDFNPLNSIHVLEKGPLINPRRNQVKQPRLQDPIKKRNPLNLVVDKPSGCVCPVNVFQSRKTHMQCTQNRRGNKEGLPSASDSNDDSPYPEYRYSPRSEASGSTLDLGADSTTVSLSGSMSGTSCGSLRSEKWKHFKPKRPPCVHLLHRNVYTQAYLHKNQSPKLSTCGSQNCGVQTSPVMMTILKKSLQQPFDCVEQHQVELTEASPVHSELKPISHTNADGNPKELCICTMRAPIFPNQFSESESTSTVAPTTTELQRNIYLSAKYQQALRREIEKCRQQAQNPKSLNPHWLRTGGMQMTFLNGLLDSKQMGERLQSHVDHQQKLLTAQPKYEENNPSADGVHQHFLQSTKQFKLEKNRMLEDHPSKEFESTMSRYKTASTQHDDKSIASTKWHCSKNCKQYTAPELRKTNGPPELASKEVQTEEEEKAGRQNELNSATERLQ
ncbi:hypothetical protein P879_08019 [Paragonimus westermani]|uniref:Uncharacterized protein n=1 Tax=Paragonimus westermani TaxID=34504 RepID=A0A8T0DBW6_9TREM|nr:hypothetical protein P879_08019 [Paragonimus westermani]